MLDREFTISVWDRAQTFMWLKRAGRYFPHVEEELAKAKMPGDLKYLAVAESSMLAHIRSSAGALGPWQFMSGTAKIELALRDGSTVVKEKIQAKGGPDAPLTEAEVEFLVVDATRSCASSGGRP